MTYTLGQLIFDVVIWLSRVPKIIPIQPPMTRRKVKTAYNSANSPLDFDADLRQELRSRDATYVSYSDTELQNLIDSTVDWDAVIVPPAE